MELELVRREHGLKSGAYRSCRKNLLQQYKIAEMFDIFTGIGLQEFVERIS